MADASKTTKPQKRVRRTQAQIAADNAAEEERRQRLAEERAAKIPAPVVPKWSKTIHFVEDGFTAFQKVWYRGEEITIEEGDQYFDRAFDSKGNFIFGLDENEQIERYGHVMYRPGPWPGLGYDLRVYEAAEIAADKTPMKPNKAEIEALERANRRRKQT